MNLTIHSNRGSRLVWLMLVAAMLLALLLAGCGSSSKAGPAEPNTVSMVLDNEPASLDPALTTGLVESDIELELFEGLTRLDSQCQPQPALAASWDISPDGKTYTFHLRPGITWWDGTPITAQDFVYSWLRCLNPETAAENAYMLFIIDNAEDYNSEKADAAAVGVRAKDDRTLEVHLKNPASYFLGLTAFHAFYPVQQASVKQKPDTWSGEAASVVGCGPYKIVSWKHSSEILLEKNERYWNAAAVKTRYLRFPISDSQSTRLTIVENGLADMMLMPPPADENRLQQTDKYHVAAHLGTSYYTFNVTKPPFDNIKVRKAFALALQRQSLVKNIVRAGKQPAYAFVPPGMVINGRDFRQEGGPLMEENVEEARQLLAESGYKGEEITILYNTSELRKAIAEAVQAMWKANLGVAVDISNQETKVFFANRLAGNYQVASADWIADFADPMNFLEVFLDKENDAQYISEEYNALVTAAQREADPEKRLALMHAAERKLLEDAVIIPIYYSTNPYVAQPWLKGYFCLPLGTIDLSQAYIEP